MGTLAGGEVASPNVILRSVRDLEPRSRLVWAGGIRRMRSLFLPIDFEAAAGMIRSIVDFVEGPAF
ncbi:MAG: hypothetical protein CBD18_00785 [Opitutales bacterium TMED158]|nr:MAG: hypothetical protein CBD18_00785 [Opitutales bacterium TMED158]